jgi:hypothetical protein
MTHVKSTARTLSISEIDHVGGGFAFIPVFWAGMKFGGAVAGFIVAAHQIKDRMEDEAHEVARGITGV